MHKREGKKSRNKKDEEERKQRQKANRKKKEGSGHISYFGLDNYNKEMMSGIFFNFREEERLRIINYSQGRERKEKKEKRD
jgi:hypothetical protein